jgi:tetratricopeptide (TPR) repeat protein
MLHADIDTASAARHYGRGSELYHRGCYREAAQELAHINSREDLMGSLARYYQALANRAAGLDCLQQGRYAEAETHLRAAADAIGSRGDLAEYLAAVYARGGKYDLCQREAEKALKAQGGQADTWRRAALAQWRSGKGPAARMTLQEAMRRFPNDPGLHLQLGLFHSAQADYAEAAACFQSAVAADGGYADAHYYLALVHAARGQTVAAVRSFQRAFELRPADIMVAHKLSLAARAAGDQGHSVTIQLGPRPVAPSGSHMLQLARYLTAEGDLVEAMLALPVSEIDGELFGMLASVLKMALAEHPDYADLHYHAAAVFQRLGQLDWAMEHARSAIAINGRYVKARLMLGRLCMQTGATSEALEHLEQAIAAGGDWADVHCLAGELEMQHGQLGAARQHMQRALQLNAGYTRAATMLAKLAA